MAMTVPTHDLRHGGGAGAASRKHRVIRVLQVEDAQSDVYLLGKMLRDASPEYEFSILDVPRLTEAIEQLGKESFDVIMLDLNLLDTDGVSSVAALKAVCATVPIIVYSGSDDRRLREEAMLCGAQHYLIKGKESPYALRFMIENAFRGQG